MDKKEYRLHIKSCNYSIVLFIFFSYPVRFAILACLEIMSDPKADGAERMCCVGLNRWLRYQMYD